METNGEMLAGRGDPAEGVGEVDEDRHAQAAETAGEAATADVELGSYDYYSRVYDEMDCAPEPEEEVQ